MTGAACCAFWDDPSIEPTNNRAERAAPWGGDRAEGVTLLEERGGGRCVLGFHQRNQDVGAQWRRPICGGSALRSLQRRSASLTITPNLPRHPLINYDVPADVTSKQLLEHFAPKLGGVAPGHPFLGEQYGWRYFAWLRCTSRAESPSTEMPQDGQAIRTTCPSTISAWASTLHWRHMS